MSVRPETIERLASLPNVTISEGALLSRLTRFGIGGPADVYAGSRRRARFIAALRSRARQRLALCRDRRGNQPDRLRRRIPGHRAALYRGPKSIPKAAAVDVQAGATLQASGRLFDPGRGLQRPRNHDRNSRLSGRGGLRQRRRLRALHRRARARSAFLRRPRSARSSTWPSASFATARVYSNSTRTGSFSRRAWTWRPRTRRRAPQHRR